MSSHLSLNNRQQEGITMKRQGLRDGERTQEGILSMQLLLLLLVPVSHQMEALSRSREVFVVEVNTRKTVANVTHFWKSTGFCPPEPHQGDCSWFLSKDMQQNLAIIGALPNSGVQQVRVHWLLGAVTVSSISKGRPVYNFTCLDSFLGLLYQAGLKPGFELMGNPSNFFSNFDNGTQVHLWKDLVQQTAQRYIDQFGLGYVEQWRFETWNEPNKHHFDKLLVTINGYLNYYDACREGLSKVSGRLRLGGPGGECGPYNVKTYCWALLSHVRSGRSFFTGDRPGPLDYISVHKKGEEPDNTQDMMNKEIDFLSAMWVNMPELTATPIVNDEADPLVGWSKDKWWRADANYAAMVVKGDHRGKKLRKDPAMTESLQPLIAKTPTKLQNIIVAHQQLYYITAVESWTFELLSNDNGFLSYNPHFFTQRTLLARFQMNNTWPPHVQFVRKPVYAVMGLLALMGEEEVHANFQAQRLKESPGYLKDIPSGHHSDFHPGHHKGVRSGYHNDVHSGYNKDVRSGYYKDIRPMASVHRPDRLNPQDSWQMTLLVYYSMDTHSSQGQVDLQVKVAIAPSVHQQDLLYVVYQLDNVCGNPYAQWLSMDKPATPSLKQLQQMRDHEGPVRVEGPSRWTGAVVNGTLLLPGVFVVHVCAKAQMPPDQVSSLSAINITSGQVLLVWTDSCVHSRCLKTYEVEYSSDGATGRYKRINTRDSFFTSFVYAPVTTSAGQTVTDDALVRGYYRVRAVDYWHRQGDFSLSIKY